MMLQGTQNCILPYQNWGQTITYVENNNWVFPYQIRPAANGFILKFNYNEYVFECVDSLIKFLKEKLKDKK